MRYPQQDEEENQRHLDEIQRLQNIKRLAFGKKDKMSFDEYMVYKQRVYDDKYHNEALVQGDCVY